MFRSASLLRQHEWCFGVIDVVDFEEDEPRRATARAKADIAAISESLSYSGLVQLLTPSQAPSSARDMSGV